MTPLPPASVSISRTEVLPSAFRTESRPANKHPFGFPLDRREFVPAPHMPASSAAALFEFVQLLLRKIPFVSRFRNPAAVPTRRFSPKYWKVLNRDESPRVDARKAPLRTPRGTIAIAGQSNIRAAGNIPSTEARPRTPSRTTECHRREFPRRKAARCTDDSVAPACAVRR